MGGHRGRLVAGGAGGCPVPFRAVVAPSDAHAVDVFRRSGAHARLRAGDVASSSSGHARGSRDIAVDGVRADRSRRAGDL